MCDCAGPTGLTCFGHALGLLDTGLQDLLGGHEEDAVAGLGAVHHAQLVHQEAAAAVHVLPPHLQGTSVGGHQVNRSTTTSPFSL